MTPRKYERQRDLTKEGEVWDGKYYTNFPDNLKMLFPMYGTKDIDTKMENTLDLGKPMIGYMLRGNTWRVVPLDGWEEISKLNTPPSYYAGVHLIKEKMDNIDKTELSHQLS